MVNKENPGKLYLTYGTMAAGKSTLALQLVWQLREHGEKVDLWTFGDRSGNGLVTSRIGISASATFICDDETLTTAASKVIEEKVRVLVVDEAQFAAANQADVIFDLVDMHKLTVHCFALATDFRGEMFPGTARFFALADVVAELPLATYCWCGERGRCNARVVNGEMVKTGDRVVIGDTAEGDNQIRYQVLCRYHYRSGVLS